jgi:hypothetical protein
MDRAPWQTRRQVVDERNTVDEKELLRAQIKAYEYYARLIARAVGGGAAPTLPRWDEQRAAEYQALADQLRQQLAELEAQEAAASGTPTAAATEASERSEASATAGSGAPAGAARG